MSASGAGAQPPGYGAAAILLVDVTCFDVGFKNQGYESDLYNTSGSHVPGPSEMLVLLPIIPFLLWTHSLP